MIDQSAMFYNGILYAVIWYSEISYGDVFDFINLVIVTQLFFTLFQY